MKSKTENLQKICVDMQETYERVCNGVKHLQAQHRPLTPFGVEQYTEMLETYLAETLSDLKIFAAQIEREIK